MKIMMIVSYDGSKFHGFQRQNNVRNVQGYLEDILSNIYNNKIEIKGSGRTDAGVHAKYQVIHFEADKKINNLKKKLNHALKDVKIKKVKVVNNSFHARHSVTSKTYLYKIDLSNKKDSNYYYNCYYNIDIKKMRYSSKLLLGTHDFHNFVAGKREDYTSTIYSIKIYRIGKILYIYFTGAGFYRYMVRNLVGALLAVSSDKVNINYLKDMIDNPNVEKRLPTCSPNGLYLVKVRYKKKK